MAFVYDEENQCFSMETDCPRLQNTLSATQNFWKSTASCPGRNFGNAQRNDNTLDFPQRY